MRWWLADPEKNQTGSEGKGSGQVHEERKASHKQKACVPRVVICSVCTILWVCHSAPLPLSISLSAHTFVCMCHQLVFIPHQGSVQTGKSHPWIPPNPLHASSCSKCPATSAQKISPWVQALSSLSPSLW